MSYSLIAAADVRTPMTDRKEFARFKTDGEGTWLITEDLSQLLRLE